MNGPGHDWSVDDFAGTERFQIRCRLGSGGMGVVYLAFDRQRNELVAVKTLRQVAPEAIYRLKREFRASSELSHPHLVRLHELFCVDQQWFFTMQYVQGRDLLQYLGADTERQAGSRTWKSPARLAGDASESGGRGSQRGEMDEDALPPPPRDVNRGDCSRATRRDAVDTHQVPLVRDILGQLAKGVHELHARGILHRDLKPSNVLVTDAAHVVILDYGLATALAADARSQTTAGMLVGTTAYMSPEQAQGSELTEASDWYSVGVILYEVLTGRTPFIGRALQVLADKQLFDPAPPSALVADVPGDLDTLCRELLARDPAARPSGKEVLRRLGVTVCETASPLSATGQASHPFVGRQQALREMDQAWRDVQRGQTVVVAVQGASAVGKSALVSHFLNSIVRQPGVVVLAGRCHERESVPYKALDSVVDALSHYLLTRPHAEVDALVPRDTGALVQLFPVLRRVDAIAAMRRQRPVPVDKQELRDLAVRALREMLERLGDRKALILSIDDLQWSDSDSASLLHDLLLPPDSPRLLLITCWRTDPTCGIESSVSRLPAHALISQSCPMRTVELAPLAEEEIRQLVHSLWSATVPAPAPLVDAIAASAEGSPYFAELLVRHHCRDGGPDTDPVPAPSTLGEVLGEQISQLDESAWQLLQAISIAAGPLRFLDACRAASLGPDAAAALTALRAAQLIRTPDTDDVPHLELYHDAIRRTVLSRLTAAQQSSLHQSLALALEQEGNADAAVIAEHFAAAGQSDRGRAYCVQAAREASAAMAFERAAELYGRAIQLGPIAGAELLQLRRQQADALAHAGRGAEAARQYEQAAEISSTADAFELQRLAAMHYLFAGEIQRGLQSLAGVLDRQGLRLPRSPRQALVQWLWLRTRLRIRGWQFDARDQLAVSPELLRRIDTCWSAATGLSFIDPISAAVFQTRGLLLALRSGEPLRIARALCVEAAHVSLRGGGKRVQVELLLERAETLANRIDHPQLRGLLKLAAGVAALNQGRWSAARQYCDDADDIFRQFCSDVAWEMDCAAAAAATALFDAGEIVQLADRLPDLRDRARRRGNLFALTAPSSMNLPELAADRPDVAQQILDDCMRHWPDKRFYVQHFSALYDRIQTDLYRGDPATAWARITAHRHSVARSLLMRVQLSRTYAYQTRARCALALSCQVDDPRQLLRLAEQDARRVEREGQLWTQPLAELLRAAVAAARGQLPAAMELLEKAVVHFDRADMVLYATAARWQLGKIRGGPAGESLVVAARDWMQSQGVVCPERLCRLFAPGFPDEVQHVHSIG